MKPDSILLDFTHSTDGGSILNPCNMSSTIISVFVTIAVQVLPYLGISVGSEQLTTTIQTLVTLGSALWIWKERVARGDVKVFGSYK